MKIQKIAKGIGVNLALDAAGRVINKLYEHFKTEKEDLASKIRNYTVRDNGESTLEERAGRYRLLDELAENASNAVDYLRKNLAYVKNITESAQDSPEASLYAKMQKAYDLLSKMLVYIPSTSPLARKMSYISDAVKGYLYMGSITHQREKFLGLLQNLDDEWLRLVYAAARKTANWLNEEVRKQKSMPSAGLESIVGLFGPKTAKLEQVKQGTLKLYHELFASRKPVYGSDLVNPGYETLDYATA